MELFDDITRDYTGTAAYGEPRFSFLNRSARTEFARIRKMLEEWFSRYPEAEQKDLRGRFRSKLEADHQGAFFELFLHELLLRLGCSVVLHPSVSGTTKVPDFLATAPDGEKFYLEARVATYGSPESVAADARLNPVYEKISQEVDSTYFFLWMHVEGAPASSPSSRKLVDDINEWLAGLDPDEIDGRLTSDGTRDLPERKFTHDGWHLTLRAIPKSLEGRGKKAQSAIGVMGTAWTRANHVEPLRNALRAKSSRYGVLNHPYVVAVNAQQHIHTQDIVNALFGTETLEVLWREDPTEDIKTQPEWLPDGAWGTWQQPRQQQVSGALIVSMLYPWNVREANLCLYHHPWATFAYSSTLTRLTQARVDNGQVVWTRGETLDDLFAQ